MWNNVSEIEIEIDEINEELNVEQQELRWIMLKPTNSEMKIERELQEIDVIELNVDKMEIEDYLLMRNKENFYPGHVKEFKAENVLVRCMENSGNRYWN